VLAELGDLDDSIDGDFRYLALEVSILTKEVVR
jgi:hypothetical protein